MQDLRQKLWKYVVVRPPTSCDTLSLSSVKSSVKSSSIIIITNVIIVMMATNIVCSAGFKHGDSVALFMENRPEYIGVHFIINIIIIITSSSSSSFCFLFLHLPPPKKIRLSGHFLRFTFRVAYQIPISNTSCLSDLHDRVVIMMMPGVARLLKDWGRSCSDQLQPARPITSSQVEKRSNPQFAFL